MDSRVFRIATTFRKPHPDLLGFPKGGLYLMSLFPNTYLGFPKDTIPLKPYRPHSVTPIYNIYM